MQMSSKVYGKLWRFNTEGLPNDLINRKLAKTEEGGALKLLLEDYPYADDGMLLWNAVEKWVGSYLALYYDDSVDDKKVANDVELQAWWTEIKEQVSSAARVMRLPHSSGRKWRYTVSTDWLLPRLIADAHLPTTCKRTDVQLTACGNAPAAFDNQ